MSKYDLILIPGGGLLEDGSLPPWTIARLDRALTLKDQCRWFALLSGGTVHKPPPLTAEGFPVFESRQAAEYLIERGIPASQILTEISSYDTIGNAFFSRMLFTQPLRLEKLMVITSRFHMPRTRAIFEWIYHLPPSPITCQIEFIKTPDSGIPPKALAARTNREEESLAKLEITRRKIGNISELCRWLYTEHQAYIPGMAADPLSEDELKSY